MKKVAKQLLLASISGILVAISFPPLGWWPCTLIAWLPLFVAFSSVSTIRKAFYIGLIQGIVAYGTSLYWLVYIFKSAVAPLIIVMSMWTGIFGALFVLLIPKIKTPALKALLAIGLWTSIEFFRSELFFMKFSWITSGIAIGPVALTPIIGVYGVSCLIFACSTCLYFKGTRIIGILLTALLIALGTFKPGPIEPTNNPIKVAAIQSESCSLSTYLSMSHELLDKKPALILWPEYAIPFDIRSNNPKTFKKIQTLAEKMDTVFILGSKTVIENSSDNWYNTALAVNKNGVLGEYYKNSPVHFFDDGIPGTFRNPIKTPIGTIGTPICFDFDFSAIMREMTILGAEYFAVPSFDAVGWSKNQHLQHSSILPIRAAENARWVVCAASSGISQIIDPHGCIHHSLAPMKEGSITGLLEARTDITFYTHIGWLFPWICMILTLATVCSITIKAVRTKYILKNSKNRVSQAI